MKYATGRPQPRTRPFSYPSSVDLDGNILHEISTYGIATTLSKALAAFCSRWLHVQYVYPIVFYLANGRSY